MSRDTPVAVRAEELTRRFGDFTAVDAVSFQVHRAEVFGFLGPNGAGKTTLIKMLAGLLAPSDGRAQVDGVDVVTGADRIQQRIGYMSQLFSLYTDLTVMENVRFFGGLYGVTGRRRAERAERVLAMARLEDQRDRLVAELPLGFRQRLALGCAILHQPPILFLDEPTSGVDPVSRRSFWDLIYDLTEEGTTVFVTTHYMEEAEYCHRLALMNRGRLIALDAPEALRRDLDLPVVEVRTAEAPRAAEVLARADGVLSAGLYGRTVHVTLEGNGHGKADARQQDAAKRVRRLLRDAGLDIGLDSGPDTDAETAAVRPIHPSLEDVFVALVEAAGGAPED